MSGLAVMTLIVLTMTHPLSPDLSIMQKPFREWNVSYTLVWIKYSPREGGDRLTH